MTHAAEPVESDVPEDEALGWDTEERDRLLLEGEFHKPVEAPVEIIVGADE